MKTICADHPTLSAVARCVDCSRHLCHGCRSKLGVRNYCRACATRELTKGARKARPVVARARVVRNERAAAAAPAAAVVSTRPVRLRSPLVATCLSALPGLGQLYGGAWFRAMVFFGATAALLETQVPAVLGCFLYVFNLWDAWQVSRLRNDRVLGKVRDEKELRRDRTDDTLFTLTGLGAMGYTFVQMGGLQRSQPAELLVQLGVLALALVVAQETRR